MPYRYTNRAKAQLAQNITPRDTIITLLPGTGSLFPIPQGPYERFALTLAAVSNPDQYEICTVLRRQEDKLTVQRGQDNTTAQSFASGDIASLNMTAGLFSLFPQAGYMGVFSADVAARINGYQKNAIVCDPNTPGLFWISTQDGNTAPPQAGSPQWMTLDVGASYASHGDIEAEARARQAADAALQDGLAQEIRDRQAGETTLHDGLAAEIRDRQAGDASLQEAITDEAAQRHTAETTLQSTLNSETQARQDADQTLQNALNAEEQTRYNADAALDSAKVNRAGDTMTGDLSLQGNRDGAALYSRTLRLGVAGAASAFNAQLLGSTGQETGVLSVVDQNGASHTWQLNASTNSITTPEGSTLPEMVGLSGRIGLQAFTITGNNHGWVSFPTAFAAPPMTLHLTAEHYPDGQGASVLASYYAATLTNAGFELDLRWIDDGSGGELSPRRVNVLAIGALASS